VIESSIKCSSNTINPTSIISGVTSISSDSATFAMPVTTYILYAGTSTG